MMLMGIVVKTPVNSDGVDGHEMVMVMMKA